MTEPALNVLVVDDDDVTAECVSRSLKKFNLNCIVTAAEDGRDALSVLRGQTNRSVRKPYVILLDLNMPRMNGFEFLDELRNDPELCNAIVFVLSTSGADTDRSRAYHKVIAGYMVKAEIGPLFSKLAALLKEYANAVRFPE
jgi:CheY-like chemotaxis protein